MEIFDRRCQMLYKNENGGRIMVRISLPQTKDASDLNSLYSALCESYLNAAKDYINRSSVKSSCFFDVSYSIEEDKNEIKIKRLANLNQGAKTIKSKTLTDVFSISDFSLKK